MYGAVIHHCALLRKSERVWGRVGDLFEDLSWQIPGRSHGVDLLGRISRFTVVADFLVSGVDFGVTFLLYLGGGFPGEKVAGFLADFSWCQNSKDP